MVTTLYLWSRSVIANCEVIDQGRNAASVNYQVFTYEIPVRVKNWSYEMFISYS